MDLDDLNDIGVTNARVALALIRATIIGDAAGVSALMDPLSREDMVHVMGGLTGVLLAIARVQFTTPGAFEAFVLRMQDAITRMEAGEKL